ncbi:ABC-type Fe3+ transport system, periplasmic component [Pseudomonas coronafaciens pv. coronafaciens]|nr:ABC-type Fe3+ transport system, periplasmic component [Pseudomonas coronafaciens pv. coronafaciens]
MKRLSITLAFAALLGANAAHSEIFKCTSPQGKVSYASIPCDETAQSALQRQGPPNIRREGEPLDYVHKTNLKATEYLKVGGRTRVTVYETERYKALSAKPPSSTERAFAMSEPALQQSVLRSFGRHVLKKTNGSPGWRPVTY